MSEKLTAEKRLEIFKWLETAEERLETTNERREILKWLEPRKEIGKTIDPATAKVLWWDVNDGDPYGVGPHSFEENIQIGRGSFACNRGSDDSIRFGDLHEETRGKLEARLERERAEAMREAKAVREAKVMTLI